MQPKIGGFSMLVDDNLLCEELHVEKSADEEGDEVVILSG